MMIFGRRVNLSGTPFSADLNNPRTVVRNPFATDNGALLKRGAPPTISVKN